MVFSVGTVFHHHHNLVLEYFYETGPHTHEQLLPSTHPLAKTSLLPVCRVYLF